MNLNNKLKITFLSSILSFILLFTTGCGLFKEMFNVKLVDNEGIIILDIEEEYKKYFPYEVPRYELTFDGIIHTTENRTTTREVIFTKNDDFKLSKILSEMFEKYKETSTFITSEYKVHKEAETYLISYENKTDGEKVYMKVLDKKVYDEVSYMNIENGLIISINYAKIIDEDNNVYYRWQNSESIRMILHYPMMVTENNEGQTMFLLLPLPAGIFYGFDTTTKDLNTILTKDKFKNDPSYYTYDYTNGWDEESVKNFYIENHNGREEGGVFLVDYFGYTFKIEFTGKTFTLYYNK